MHRHLLFFFLFSPISSLKISFKRWAIGNYQSEILNVFENMFFVSEIYYSVPLVLKSVSDNTWQQDNVPCFTDPYGYFGFWVKVRFL